jgi:pimeloyl-ACP methyl ester carboxylesterase
MIADVGLGSLTTRLDRPDWLPKAVWPFETFSLRVDDLELAVTDAGNGPVLLFVHTGMWSFLWRDVMKLLSSGFRCVCFDAPGSGRSLGPGDAEITLHRAARSVASVIENLGLTGITLVLHDLGGLAGLAGVTGLQERISGVVAMNTFAWRPHKAGLRFMLALMGSRSMREIDVITQYLPRITITDFGIGRHMDQESRAAFLAGMGTRGIRAFHDYMHDARRCHDLYGRIAALLHGPFSRLPFLTVFGELNDPFGFQQRWKELFDNSTDLVVPGGHHFPMCDAPDLVASTIRSWHQSLI